jgi:DNA-binding XRE family transcriptional regulator
MFNRERANQLREAQGREVAWLAKQLDRSRDVTNDYLTGKREPDRPLAITMALAFGVPISELWTEKTEQNQIHNSTEDASPAA